MKISEHFYSIQGEGDSQGIPAYFIRLTGCNLMCGGSKGILVDEGKATWWCDTENVWRNGGEYSNEQLLEELEKSGQLENILDGTAHVIWTGGEPMQSQLEILDFLKIMDDKYSRHTIYNEIETNGTIRDEGLYDRLQQINCSPKLANSGMKANIRIIPEALEDIKGHNNYWFKFVISNEEDILEIQDTYLKPFQIPKEKVILMPAVTTLEDLSERTRFSYEMTKKYGYRTITRGHILAWDKTTEV